MIRGSRIDVDEVRHVRRWAGRACRENGQREGEQRDDQEQAYGDEHPQADHDLTSVIHVRSLITIRERDSIQYLGPQTDPRGRAQGNLRVCIAIDMNDARSNTHLATVIHCDQGPGMPFNGPIYGLTDRLTSANRLPAWDCADSRDPRPSRLERAAHPPAYMHKLHAPVLCGTSQNRSGPPM